MCPKRPSSNVLALVQLLSLVTTNRVCISAHYYAHVIMILAEMPTIPVRFNTLRLHYNFCNV